MPHQNRLHILDAQPSVLNHFLAEIREVGTQEDRQRFRRNMERIGEIMAYEISKTLNYEEGEVETPLGQAPVARTPDRIVLATVLRAGLPLHQGLLNYFDKAENAFISAYRKHHKDGSFEIELEYVSCPRLEDTVLILADPMLATGSSMVLAARTLTDYGQPRAIHLVAAIGARLGVDYVLRKLPQAHLWLGSLDEELTAKSYIVPGLGDAGDLSYGQKLQD
jgi:uracil phosphoribosyltransferase